MREKAQFWCWSHENNNLSSKLCKLLHHSLLVLLLNMFVIINFEAITFTQSFFISCTCKLSVVVANALTSVKCISLLLAFNQLCLEFKFYANKTIFFIRILELLHFWLSHKKFSFFSIHSCHVVVECGILINFILKI